jgi:UDP-2,3-diacylglucosamine pyrophosphatase LpxH
MMTCEGSGFATKNKEQPVSSFAPSFAPVVEAPRVRSGFSERPASHPNDESLLVLSDVHLGSDLNDKLAGDGMLRRSKSVDADLISLLEHYRSTKPTGKRWRLVVAGDFIDFIGMTIEAGDSPISTEPSEEERAHGLGNSADHARVKLMRVAIRHRDVFASMARFVAVGNTLTIVHGNHDLEFHWDVVKAEMRKALAELAKEFDPEIDLAAFDARIEFNPWFFYIGGVAYIEHGHQYDPFCATPHVMAPFSPLDPRRMARGFCDVLLRFVVKPTRGLREHGHETLGLSDYLAFGAKLGVRGGLQLGVRFFRAVMELFRVRRAELSEAAKALRAEHERRLTLLGEATRIGIDRLRALAALQVPPVTHSIRGILASVLLDRLALAFTSIFALLCVAVFVGHRGYFWGSIACVAAAWILVHRYLASQRQLDPAEQLIERASKLARLFPAAFVVMGHTHIPVRVPVNDGASTYINVGSWAEEEADPTTGEGDAPPPTYRAARTHLVIHPVESGSPVAEFLTWDTGLGPRNYVTKT